MVKISEAGKQRILQNKGAFVFHEHKFICVDCGCIIDMPKYRIKTNKGWAWLCEECKNKMKGGE